MKFQLQNFYHLPDSPGVYLFFDHGGELVYVSKATSLKNRVSSYFRGQRTIRPIEQMMHQVAKIDWQTTDSVLEAIILEANLIKAKQPKYNVDGKDDKSWNYIGITKDMYPSIVTIRQHELQQLKKQNSRFQIPDSRFFYLFGPYPGLNTKATMKVLRKLFHFPCFPS